MIKLGKRVTIIVRPEHGLVDRAALRIMTGRTQSLITAHCTPVACDVKTRKLLYWETDAVMLSAIPCRGRTGSAGTS